jgi:hypothetical protein
MTLWTPGPVILVAAISASFVAPKHYWSARKSNFWMSRQPASILFPVGRSCAWWSSLAIHQFCCQLTGWTKPNNSVTTFRLWSTARWSATDPQATWRKFTGKATRYTSDKLATSVLSSPFQACWTFRFLTHVSWCRAFRRRMQTITSTRS